MARSPGREASDSGSVDVLADDLFEAIKGKTIGKNSLAPEARKQVTLALDADPTPGHALKPVVNAFRARYGEAVNEYGFVAIWVVGPTSSLTLRLDEPVSLV